MTRYTEAESTDDDVESPANIEKTNGDDAEVWSKSCRSKCFSILMLSLECE
jgi:hypothetical protein